jgi:hypothetical protein
MLRCLFNNQLLWSVVHRPGDGRLGEPADEHRASSMENGWTVTE